MPLVSEPRRPGKRPVESPEDVRYGDDAATGREDPFDVFHVHQLLGPAGTGCVLAETSNLKNAAAALASSSRTAGVVVGEDGNLIGLFTENDVMRIYFEGGGREECVGAWLDRGPARASASQLQRLTVQSSDPLSIVAERMVTNALAGDCASHHVVVQDDGGSFLGVLSSLDMVRVLCNTEIAKRASKRPAMRVPVRDIMKPREAVFTCPPETTMRDVLRRLIVSQQNSLLIVDDDGVCGVVTPRDVVHAFAEAFPISSHIRDWLRGLPIGPGSRLVASNAELVEAANLMAARDLHHLVVVLPDRVTAAGTLSSLDLVLHSQPRALRLLHSPQSAAGPTLGDVVNRHEHYTASCGVDTTLREAAELLLKSGRTSAATVISSPSKAQPLRLLTEGDLLHAYVAGWSQDDLVEACLARRQKQGLSLPWHELLVSAAMPLMQASAQMLNLSEPGREPCHHLIVASPDDHWLGVFSALDIARALCSIQSELDLTKFGADQMPVSMVMKTRDTVPTCRPEDTIQKALGILIRRRHTAVLVTDQKGDRGLVTPRCALRALAQNVPLTTSVSSWLQSRGEEHKWREVRADSKLDDAAAMMVASSLHHLIVVAPDIRAHRTVGVLSALDLARGVASVSCHTPFASLGWLKSQRGQTMCSLWAT